MYRVIIAGSSDFDNLPYMIECCDPILKQSLHLGIEIVSGKQKKWHPDKYRYVGADLVGELYANYNGYPVKEFYAQWEKYRPKDPKRKNPAGMIRNKQMGDYAYEGPYGGCLFAFWNGYSPGTRHMITYADSISLPVRIFHFKSTQP